MAFGGELDDDQGVMSDINMTPMVDIMLVLLIIFIITVPVLTHSVRVDLPSGSSAVNIIKPETITVAVTESGSIHWNEAAVTRDELEQRLTAISQNNPQPEVHIRGDKKVAYEHVVEVMVAAQQAGILKLGFVTEPSP